MIQEEILLKKSKTGTTVFYFVPNVTPAEVPILEEPAYVILNSYNQPIFFSTFNGRDLWKLETENDYLLNVELSSVTTNYLTGYSISKTFNTILTSNQKTLMEQRFNDNITEVITGKTQVPLTYQTLLFYEQKEIDDMFVNVKLNRTNETLDTFKVYNKPVNTIPTQEARTGVIFGKLQAIQSLKDEEGNHIKIPLRNVPIGIFNKSEDYPSTTSVNDDGDRFYMNLKEASFLNQYFDKNAFDEDQKFLKSNSQLLQVPEKFKYITKTNDNGEFVIYDAPLGNQVMVLEVDLFKQGLTKDEIILNNFPFPTDDESIIGEFPCYYYNQVPVDVVPAWGTSQTGYTELNINVNLDLRKWTTYIFPPAAYGKERLESTVARSAANTFKIQVRDMTTPKFAAHIIEMAQITNDLDRRPGAKFLWYNEFAVQRQQVQYYQFGCHVLKLPANLYDPNGYKTDNNGVPTNSRGVFLAAYQFSCFINNERCVRSTGTIDDGTTVLSHFDVNFFPGAGPTDQVPFKGLGVYPYEKPWSINYPSPYSIPRKPTQLRFNWDHERTYGPISTPGGNDIIKSKFVFEEPAYADGDLVGNVWNTTSGALDNVGGFGWYSTNGVIFPNRIAFVATKDYMYKYERGVAWNEKYANGYEPYWSPTNTGPYPLSSYPGVGTNPGLAGMSSVVGGEKYQRLECGYGYFMKYQDWPRVYRWEWFTDLYFGPDQRTSPGGTGAGIYGNYNAIHSNFNNIWDIDEQNFAFAFDQFTNNKLNRGGIDIYRIVDSGIDDILIPKNFIIPTYMNLRCDWGTGKADNFTLFNSGSAPALMENKYNGQPIYFNDANGSTGVLSANQSKLIYPGGYLSTHGVSTNASALAFTGVRLPGNASFDSNLNRYQSCVYTLEVNYNTGDNGATTFNVPAYISPQDWFINALQDGSTEGVVSAGCTDDFDYDQNSSQDYPVPGSNSRHFYRPCITNFSCVSPYRGFYWDNNNYPNGGIIA
jgi:hypothetical protein